MEIKHLKFLQGDILLIIRISCSNQLHKNIVIIKSLYKIINIANFYFKIYFPNCVVSAPKVTE